MKYLKSLIFTGLTIAFTLGCSNKHAESNNSQRTTSTFQTIGSIERLDEELDLLLDTTTKIEVLAEGFDWVEGPLWVESKKMLLFSDVPQNKIYQWTETEGNKVFLTPSGYTDVISRGGEMGSNGLILSPDLKLVMCQHGNRQIATMDAPLDSPKPNFIPLAATYLDGRRLNSPNDLTYSLQHELYFTDPPFGLEKGIDDPTKELGFQGVFKITSDGSVVLLTDKLSRPNGITFSPDGKKLYVANCDAQNPIWMEYNVNDDGIIDEGRVFFDATPYVVPDKGLPDSMKMHPKGYLFAAAIDGLWIFNLQGKRLGIIHGEGKISNCAFDSDFSTLYITNANKILRVKLRA